MTLDCPEFELFVESVGSDVAGDLLTQICEAYWNDDNSDVTITDLHRHDAINVTVSGHLTHEGREWHFIIDDGNWAGTVVREWGTVDEVGCYEPPPPTIFRLVPLNDNLEAERPQMYKVYLAWKSIDWFKKLESDYNYDRHFAPGSKTESHYRAKASAKGLKFELQDVV